MKLRIGGQLAVLVAIPLLLLITLTIVGSIFAAQMRSANDAQLASNDLAVHVRDISFQFVNERFANSKFWLSGKASNRTEYAARRANALADLEYVRSHAALINDLPAAVDRVAQQIDAIDERSDALNAAGAKRRQDVLDAYDGKRTPAALRIAAILKVQTANFRGLDERLGVMSNLVIGKVLADKARIDSTIALQQGATISRLAGRLRRHEPTGSERSGDGRDHAGAQERSRTPPRRRVHVPHPTRPRYEHDSPGALVSVALSKASRVRGRCAPLRCGLHRPSC